MTASGGLGQSTEANFVTSAADSGPELGDVAVTRVTSTTATIAWLTGTGAAAQIEYGQTANYTGATVLKVFRLPTQDITVPDLLPHTTYHYRVKAWDGLGALGASADGTFSTAATGPTMLFGEPIVYPRPVGLPGGQATAYQYVAKESGQANVLQLFIDGGGAAVVRVGLYSDASGTPGDILTQGSAPALTSGWAAVNIAPVGLVQGQSYWIVVLSPLGTVNVRELGIGGASVTSRQSALAAMPSTWVSGDRGTRGPMAVWVQQMPPAVTLMGPSDGSAVSGKTTLTAVVDDDQTVTRLQFLVDGQPVGPSLTAAPYTFDWDTTSASQAQPHLISARASDVLGRSGTSASVAVQVDNGPTIGDVTVNRGRLSSSVVIEWTTDVASDTQVEFGPTDSYGSMSPLNGQAVVNHQAEVTGLTPGSVYHFRVRSRDASGALALSVDGLFVTPSPGT
jgi:hypothetical protein